MLLSELLFMRNRYVFPLFEVDNPYLVPFLIRIAVFVQYVVWCGSKIGSQNDTFKKKLDCVFKI